MTLRALGIYLDYYVESYKSILWGASYFTLCTPYLAIGIGLYQRAINKYAVEDSFNLMWGKAAKHEDYWQYPHGFTLKFNTISMRQLVNGT